MWNGLITYDRAVAKPDLAAVRQANLDVQSSRMLESLTNNGLGAGITWNYTTQEPGTNWDQPDFKAEGWKVGLGGFGSGEVANCIFRTPWNTSDIWLRRELVVEQTNWWLALLQLHHGDDAEVYLNGVLAGLGTGSMPQYYEIPLHTEAAAALRPGTNVLAVHCHQTNGVHCIDAQLLLLPGEGKGQFESSGR